MKRRTLKIAAVLVALALAGMLVVVSGVIPLRASSGHWAITQWFLRFAMQRSIATHSLGVGVPKLDDAGLVLKGAGHYETACRACHGSPGTLPPRVAQQMLPMPPDLRERVGESEPRKLFYVVKHGMKFTGMPAWPAANRDDEVWAVVAFLMKLPELDEAEYRSLVHGERAPAAPPDVSVPGGMPATGPSAVTPEATRAVVQTCARCHGSDGLGRGSDVFPKLAGQRREYLQNALVAYALGKRHSGLMEPIAAGLSSELARELAAYYAGLKPRVEVVSHPRVPGEEAVARGRKIAHEGIPSQRVPSCVDCHVQEGRRTKPAYPLLAGQPAEYLLLQLRLFKAGHRGGSEYAHLMQEVAPRLTEEQMRDVAEYFASMSAP